MQITINIDSKDAVKAAAVLGVETTKSKFRAKLDQAKAKLDDTFGIVKPRVAEALDTTKDKFVATPVGQLAQSRMQRLNAFISQPKVVKFATTALAVETAFGAIGCVVTSTTFFAMGNPIMGSGVIIMYIAGVSVRYVIAHGALIGESK